MIEYVTLDELGHLPVVRAGMDLDLDPADEVNAYLQILAGHGRHQPAANDPTFDPFGGRAA